MAGGMVRPGTADDRGDLERLERTAGAPCGVGEPSVCWSEIDLVARVRVLEVEHEIVAFLLLAPPRAGHYVVRALTVHPEHRDRGYDAALLTHLLDDIRARDTNERPAVSTALPVDDIQALRLFLDHDFVGRRALDDYFGPGRPGLHCVYKSRFEYLDPDERYELPLTGWQTIRGLIAGEKYAMTAAYVSDGRPVVEIARFEIEDIATLQSDEAAAGITFAAGVLAAITFVLGFSFTSARYPDDIKMLLLGAALATTIALIVYANASGELARLRSNAFTTNMKWGNVLSEHGGVLPFMVSLEVTYARTTNSVVAAMITSAVASVALALYYRSRFSLASRFHRSVWTRLFSGLIILAPAGGALTVRYSPISWPWTLAFSGALLAQGSIYLFARPDETVVRGLRRQTRR